MDKLLKLYKMYRNHVKHLRAFPERHTTAFGADINL